MGVNYNYYCIALPQNYWHGKLLRSPTYLAKKYCHFAHKKGNVIVLIIIYFAVLAKKRELFKLPKLLKNYGNRQFFKHSHC